MIGTTMIWLLLVFSRKTENHFRLSFAFRLRVVIFGEIFGEISYNFRLNFGETFGEISAKRFGETFRRNVSAKQILTLINT